MNDSRDDSPVEENVVDLSQQSGSGRDGSRERRGSEDDRAPKAKRCSACTLCRKRKLKCDGARPACSTCSRLQHNCSYDELRKKSGPKRGYVKLLEQRLAQVETLLKTSGDPPATATTTNRTDAPAHVVQAPMPHIDLIPQVSQAYEKLDVGSGIPDGDNATAEATYPWEMISLGLDEPLPIQPVVDELNQIYFDKFHQSLPMMHRPRYYAAMHLAPHTRPPVCLRYAMWCNAASSTDKYDGLQEHFYHRARKYIQQDEMKGHGESMLTVAHVQTWVLLATYEFKKMYFPRAWMSSGRATRLAQMIGLNRVDTSGLQVKQCIPPPRDRTEQEERRRTFWSAFCIDRYASIGTGWPMSIEEQDIQTRMPGSDVSFDLSKPENTSFLADAFEPSGSAGLSSFGGVVFLAALFGRNLIHLHRPKPGDDDNDLNGEFWKRHRDLDSILLNTSLSLPDHLRLPSGLNNPNVVFLHMSIHTSTICLHQAAIFKTDTSKNRIPARISAESKVRCITAAAETASIMRTICHQDLSAVNPFISFSLYVAARVFVQYLRSRPNDHHVRSSLRFLLSAMHAIKRKNPLTESFLMQLDVDLEGAGLDVLRAHPETTTLPGEGPSSCGSGGLILDDVGQVPTYGDRGMAAFNSPTQNIVDAAAFKNIGYADVSADFNTMQTGLPNRQRASGEPISEMDTSPDGGGEWQYSGSSTQNLGSSRTPSTAYSPPQQLQPDPSQLTTEFGSAYPAMNMGNSYDGVQQPGGTFMSSHDWDNGFQSLPGSIAQGSGFNTMSGGELGDVMAGMSDAEWNTVLASMSDWDSGLNQVSMNVL